MAPRVSVLMAVHNEEQYLRGAVQSILGQTFAGFEFVIIDDGSTDRTPAILDEFTDPRIVRLANPTNLGLVASLNRGSDACRGEWVARMDADDASHPERLARQLSYLDEHPDVGVLGTHMQQQTPDGSPKTPFCPPQEHEAICWKMLFECATAHATVMMRRQLLIEHGGYDPAFTHIEDGELWSRLVSVTRFANLPELLYVRCWHPDSVCNRHLETQLRLGMVIRRRMVEGLLGRGVDDEAAELLWNYRTSGALADPSKVKALVSLLLEIHEAHCRRYPAQGREVAADVRADLTDRLTLASGYLSRAGELSASREPSLAIGAIRRLGRFASRLYRGAVL